MDRLVGMTSKLVLVRSLCTPQRVVAAAVFLPVLAYAFPPFLVADLPFLLRLIFWTGVMGLALSATWVARKLVRDKLAKANLHLRDLAFAALLLAFLTPSLWLLAWVLFTYGGHMAPALTTVANYGILFSAGLFLVRRNERDEPKTDEPPRAVPRLTRRLPPSFSGRVFRLAVRDHYVDVVTSEGTFTVRSRLTDAIAEMEPVSGHCTHRSHWVADDAIRGIEKADGKTWLRLVNGDLVPVSRKYRPELEQDGLI